MLSFKITLNETLKYASSCCLFVIIVIIFSFTVAFTSDINRDIIKASKRGDLKNIRSLIEQGADVNVGDSLGWSPLKIAAANDKVDAITLLLENGADINAQYNTSIRNLESAVNGSALHNAAFDGKKKSVKILIEKGALLNEENSYHMAPIVYASLSGKTEIIKMFIEAGVDQTALLWSGDWYEMTKKNDLKSYETIIKEHPNTIYADEAIHIISNSEYAFFETVSKGTEDAVKGFKTIHPESDRNQILNQYLQYIKQVELAKISSAHEFMKSSPDNPFTQAVKIDFPQIYLKEIGARLYLDNIKVVGAKYNKREDRYKGALIELNKMFESGGLTLHEEPNDSITHSIEVIASGNISAGEKFGQAIVAMGNQIGASMATLPSSSNRTINVLKSQGRKSIIESLISGDNNNQYSDVERLHITINRLSDSSQIYEDLEHLNVGKRSKYISKHNNPSDEVKLVFSIASLRYSLFGTELKYLSENNDLKSVTKFLDNTPHTKYYQENGTALAALIAAINNGSLEMVTILLDRVADVNMTSSSMSTALNVAVAKNNMEMVNLLLGKKADVNLSDNNGLTPIFLATENVDMISLLIDHGADVNHQANDGSTALILTAEKGNYEVAEILVKNGADRNLSDKDNNTPLSLATKNNLAELIELLRNY